MPARPVRTSHPWAPASLGTSLIAWYDSSDASTLTLSGSNVTAWADKSGNSKTLTLAAGAGPVSGTRTQNGLNVLDFQGATSMLGSPVTSSQPCTIGIVCLSDHPDGGLRYVQGDDGAGQAAIYVSGDRFVYTAGSAVDAGIAENTSARILSARYNGSSSYFRANGVQTATGNPGNVNGFSSARLGGEATNTYFWKGWIAEVMYISAALSAQDLSDMEAFLNTHWAVY